MDYDTYGYLGIAAGARDVMNTLLAELAKRDVKDVVIVTADCAGLCRQEPMAIVEIIGQAPVKYINLNEEKIKRILSEHVLEGKVVAEYVSDI